MLVGAVLLGFLIGKPALAQFSLTLEVDQGEAAAALGAQRVPKMNEALDRVKNFFERALINSTAVLAVPVRWQPPSSPTAAADSGVAAPRLFDWATVRDRLIDVGNEPASETNVYEALPLSQVPFVWATTDNPAQPRTASLVLLTFAQAQQLQFNPTGPLGDELRIRVRSPSANTIKWQFYPGPLLPGYVRFDAVMVHEVLHFLGFQSAAEASSAPSSLALQDVYRLADGDIPAGVGDLEAQARELRPSLEASLATRVNSDFGTGAYRMSRGARPGGDTFQASHFRAAARLTPPHPIGVMDPSTELTPDQRIAAASRADMEVLDLLGWTLNPATVDLQIAGGPHPDVVGPANGALIRGGRPTFTWTDTTTNSEFYAINLFEGDPNTYVNRDPVIFDRIFAFSFTIPEGQELVPGIYYWTLVGRREAMLDGYYEEAYRTFTILCLADITGIGGTAEAPGNPDGQLTVDDIIVFINLFSDGGGCPGPGAPSGPACNLADVTGIGGPPELPDGQLTVDDIIAFFNAFSGGCGT